MLTGSARNMMGQIRNGDIDGLRSNTIPAVASSFGGIASSAEALKPDLQQATLTVDHIYVLDATQEQSAGTGIQFFCSPASSTMTVVLNFSDLPAGKYAVAILHATGVAKPEQISLVLNETGTNQWKLAGFFSKPMTMAGHDGVWYWEHARDYSQKKMNWDAWFYYQTAAFLLDPADFLSSPNLEKLNREENQVRPEGLRAGSPMPLNANGATFQIISYETSGALGGLDFVVHYTPDANQAAQLRDPVAARKQAVDVMSSLLSAHPELREAFRGIWIRADQGNASLFALELPMSEIAESKPEPMNSTPR
ncbi:MAG: hypothetical protein JOZ33_07465 [Acidobacteriaceae bacterium]|nr:hypothetical protein [Acidobacteriaceae bacterium]